MMKYLNNKPTRTFLLYSGLALLCFSVGCSKGFLTQTDPSNTTFDNYFTQPVHGASIVNAAYSDLNAVYNGGRLGGAPWLMLEFATGMANTTSLGASGLTNSTIVNLGIAPDNPYLITFWESYYHGIANANVAINKIPGIPMDEKQKSMLLGEARFLRAFYYFNLVRVFGDVPLILDPIDLASKQLYPERTPAAEVYKAIVEDLDSAEVSGLPFTDNSGHVSLGAVKTLMASVYLTMAGYPLQAGSEYYQLAKDKAADVINSGEFNLFDSYADLHSESTENQGENIFMVQFDKVISNRNTFQQLFLPLGKAISAYSNPSGMIYPVKAFVESYEPGDQRAEEKQFYYSTFTLKADRNQTIELGGWYIYKWLDSVAVLQTATSGLNWPLFRYAETLFLFAEASNEVSGPTKEAYDAINAIRQRASLKPLSGLSQDEFRQAIWREKWHEMCFENKTWFDMVRIRKAYNLTTNTFDDFIGHTFSYGPVLSEKDLLFPIPVTEVQNNKNLTQNPGY